MFKTIITGIFVFLAFGIISVLLWYENADETLGSLYLKKKIEEPRVLTIREIDDMSASTNLRFSIKNKIVHTDI